MKTMARIVYGSLLCVCTQGGVLLADEDAVPELSSEIWPSLIKLVGALALILVIIYGSVWLLKRFSLGKTPGGGELISIVDRRFLAPKQALYLIKVGGKHVLVGSSEAGLTAITTVGEEDLAAKPSAAGNAPAESTFNRVLKQARQTFMPMLRVKEAGAKVEAE
jgi:flagellar biosynthetic protein FliO